jgi:RNA recognition motif-containing protein
MNIYVGNLSYDATDDDLRKAFEAFGEVSSVNVIRDKNTGRSRGFGFVEMASEETGQAAIDGLNGSELLGRNLNINVARPRNDRPAGRGRREY